MQGYVQRHAEGSDGKSRMKAYRPIIGEKKAKKEPLGFVID